MLFICVFWVRQRNYLVVKAGLQSCESGSKHERKRIYHPTQAEQLSC